MMKILAFDLGTVSAYVVANQKQDYVDFDWWSNYKIETPLLDLKERTERALQRHHPNVILVPYPTRFYNVIIKHSKMIGIIELLGEEYSTTVLEVNDAQCKKVVLGSGKSKKADIMNYFKEKNEHLADCKMFIEWYFKSI